MEQQDRLAAFERMLAAVQQDGRETAVQMERLRAEGKTKTARFGQLMTHRLQCAQLLALYKVYGLID